jgi:hypothetical protein
MGSFPATRAGDHERHAAPGAGGRSVQLLDFAPFLTLILVGVRASGAIGDNSFLWHVRSGSAQRAMTAVFTEDPFSYTMAGQPWRTQSWLVELLYSYLESSFASLAWVSWMIFFVGCATAVLIIVSLRSVVDSLVSVTLALIPVLWLMAPFLQPRPVVFSFMFLAALVVVLQHRQDLLWAVVPIIWIWAASHGSWVIGGGLIVLEWIRSGDWRLFRAGLTALAVTLLTAHGLGAWTILTEFAGAREALDGMQEWATPDFTSIVHLPFVLLIVGMMVGMMRGRIVPRDLVVIVPFILLGMSANRSIVPATIVLAPWAATALPDISIPTTRRPAVVIAALAALTAAFALLPMMARPTGVLDPERFPSTEIVAGLDGRRAFYSDLIGGYLIFHSWPEQLVYIDDRAELYGAEFLSDYEDAVEGAYEELFATYRFDAALTDEDWRLTRRLESDGWELVAVDDELRLYYAP